jgi:hypothetical protein
MSDNNPFDRPPMQPSPPPPSVSGDWGPTTPFNPIGPRQGGPGRGKIVAVALGAVALTGGAIFGIAKFADDDDDKVAEASGAPVTAPVVGAGSENVGGENGQNAGGENGDATPMPSIPEMLDSLSECIDIEEILGSMGGGEAGNVTIGSMPSLDFSNIGESVGDTVMIASADGVTVYTLGEGDASIAISKSGGKVTVAASGDLTESTVFDFGDFETQMNDMMGELEGMDVDDMPAVSLPADFDPAEIQACIENLDLDGSG